MAENSFFYEEKAFAREQYRICLRRLEYDDRDVIMYEDMLEFLWQYVIRPGCLCDYEGLLREYTRWNLQMIQKCYYHPHDLAYANIRRSYQTVVCLLGGALSEGGKQFEKMGIESFRHDGRAPKLHMTKEGKVYRPASKLFLLYNYYKVWKRRDEAQANRWKESYEYAFAVFGDEEHREHDAFLKSQMEEYEDLIFYPVFERIYKLPWKPKDFYLYWEPEASISIDQFLERKEKIQPEV
ncbi:MAG: hypothetical protein Q4D60_08070 [Eubacteriales bacterium]|nr:hypothetical protein [Eubacteriales bacterium]